MDPTLRAQLLACEKLGPFLVLLRGEKERPETATLLYRYGGPATPQAVGQYETGARGISSRVQWAYVCAFQLDAELSLRLQRLAGEAKRRPGRPNPEPPAARKAA